MLKWFVAIVLVLTSELIQAADYTWSTFGRLNHFAKKPSSGILAGGRLTSREVSEIAEAGFRSFVSIANFTTSDDSYNSIKGNFPSTAEEKGIVEGYGLSYSAYPVSLTVEDVNAVSNILSALPKPVYIHCHVGFSASLFTSLHLYKTGAIDPAQIISKGVSLGYNFLSNSDVVKLINDVTGSSFAYSATPLLELSLTNQEASYKSYYWPHRVGNDTWYNIGQVLDTHVQAIQANGYKTVLSLRVNGEGTTRLSTDPAIGPVDNHEFSDSKGNYDVNLERAAFEAVGVDFVYFPLSSATAWSDTTAFFTEFVPTLQKVEKNGPALLHCASGYRSSSYLVTYLALINNHCADWALSQAALIGFSFDESSADQSVVNFIKAVLKC